MDDDDLISREWNELLDDDVLIAFGTNVWLVSGEEPINLQALLHETDSFPVASGNPCYQCWPEPLPGVLTAMNSEDGIERCDNCTLYEGDLEAARALADLIELTVPLLAPVSVWYHPEQDPR